MCPTVQWGEMDSFGHVNNALYLRYAEGARLPYLYALLPPDHNPNGVDLDGNGVIIASISIRFKAPLTFPDQIVVGVRTSDMGVDYMGQQQGVCDVT